jgi:RNA polymerase sigma-70 factor (ECF subfamily)
MGSVPFEAVVTTHHGEIYQYVRRVTASAAEADDLSQETFLRAYRAYHSLDASANVRAWLFTIATNLCRNHFRAEKRRRAAQAAVRASVTGEPIDTGPEGEALGREASALIEATIVRLPLKQRLAFTLRKIHELDYPAIAESLNCSTDSARAHVFQALRKVRHSLNGHELPVTEPQP